VEPRRESPGCTRPATGRWEANFQDCRARPIRRNSVCMSSTLCLGALPSRAFEDANPERSRAARKAKRTTVYLVGTISLVWRWPIFIGADASRSARISHAVKSVLRLRSLPAWMHSSLELQCWMSTGSFFEREAHELTLRTACPYSTGDRFRRITAVPHLPQYAAGAKAEAECRRASLRSAARRSSRAGRSCRVLAQTGTPGTGPRAATGKGLG